MKLLDTISKARKDAEERKKTLILLHQQREALQQYWEQYWQIALVLWEVIGANNTVLKVLPPKQPRQLLPPGYNPKNLDNYTFILKRTNTNTIGGDNSVVPFDICKHLTIDMRSCGFFGFDIKCGQDDILYYVTIKSHSDFVIGRPISSQIGTLFVNTFYNAQADIFIYAYDVKYYDKSTYGGIRDGKIINIYHQGEFIPSVTGRNALYQPCLSRLPKNPRKDCDYLVIV